MFAGIHRMCGIYLGNFEKNWILGIFGEKKKKIYLRKNTAEKKLSNLWVSEVFAGVCGMYGIILEKN
jgi:hypothetical protein